MRQTVAVIFRSPALAGFLFVFVFKTLLKIINNTFKEAEVKEMHRNKITKKERRQHYKKCISTQKTISKHFY